MKSKSKVKEYHRRQNIHALHNVQQSEKQDIKLRRDRSSQQDLGGDFT
uniref:Uncharacterized protein n=1 Tax=Anguilla anguilla TaxID=7936 RepID=A0A0E9XTK6_ANGAN